MIKANLFPFWQDKEKELGRKLTALEVSAATGIHRNTISTYLKGEVDNPDTTVIDRFCKFFDIAEGSIPFLTYTPD